MPIREVTAGTCACGEEAIGWCLLCDKPLCDEHAVPVRDHDRLCQDCAARR